MDEMKRRKKDSCEKLDRIHRTLRVPWIVLNVAMVVLLALASILLVTLLSSPAQAMTAIVDSLADTDPYDNPDTKDIDESRDGVCADEFGNCTLHAAIMEASRRNEPAIITFSVTGTIRLILGELQVPDGSTIDGAGPIVGQRVTVEGNIRLRSNSTIRNLIITGNSSNFIGISVDGNDNVIGGTAPETRNTISGNNGVGISLKGNQNAVIGNDIIGNKMGIIVWGNDNVIGGTAPETQNTISENIPDGISLWGNRNVVIGNDIVKNGVGIHVMGNDNVIGGTALGEYNVISENGVSVGIGSITGIPMPHNNQLIGNFIGTDAAGNARGNSLDGVAIMNSQGNTIALNTIAFNESSGVTIGVPIVDIGSTQNKISQNSIFANGFLGIDLINLSGPYLFMVTPNDPGDADSGPNNLQNFPVLVAASSDSTDIEGTLNSTPNTTFTIELFSNTTRDPSGFGEGEKFITSTMVTTDGSGNASFSVALPDTVPPGRFITATATDPNGNTSEFSYTTKEFMITFDDGPGPESTPYILDQLKNIENADGNPVKAGFFLVGKDKSRANWCDIWQCNITLCNFLFHPFDLCPDPGVASNPDIVRRIAKYGHYIGIHTQHHPDLSKLSLEDVENEILSCYSSIVSTGITPMKIFRSPYLHDPIITSGSILQDNGWKKIWGELTDDFFPDIPFLHSEDSVIDTSKKKIEQAKESPVILIFHDFRGLPGHKYNFVRIVNELVKAGYKLVDFDPDKASEDLYVNFNNTPSGRDILVILPSNSYVRFLEVLNAGNTDAEIIETGQPLPPNYKVLAIYDMSTTANYSGTIRVTFAYDPTNLSNEEKNSIKILHYEDSQWIDVTDTDQPDDTNGTISGTVDSLSLFAVVVEVETSNLTITKGGTGNGTVISSPAGINCGMDCSESYTKDTFVTLTATPDGGSTFAGWRDACSGTGSCTLTMNSSKTATAIFTPPLNIGVSALDGEVGIPYNISLGISGGLPPYTIRVVKGALPAGLSFNSEDIIGTPAKAGSSNFTVRVSDDLDSSVSKKVKMKIFKAVSIATKSLGKGRVGKKYSATLKAAGGKKAYTWLLVSGSLPEGLGLDPFTGKFAGTSTESGSFNLTFQVTDALGGTASKSLLLDVK